MPPLIETMRSDLPGSIQSMDGQSEETPSLILSSRNSPVKSPKNITRRASTGSRPVPPSRQTPKRRLSHELKTGTVESHKMAEEVHFVRNFIKGDIRRESFVDLTVNLYFVYESLEKALDAHAGILGQLYKPDELRRAPALLEDLDFWTGRDADELRPSPATEDYVRRIEKLSASDPLLLVAHAYTRYMGDLSGGTVLARVARRALGLAKDGDGLRFYDFGKISPKSFKDQYRVALDDTNLDDSTICRMVDEANVAFALNMRLFQEIDVAAGISGAELISFEEALAAGKKAAIARANSSEKEDEEEAKCPFGFTSGNGHVRGHDVKLKVFNHNSGKGSSRGSGRCPWPFVVLHDPTTFMRDYQTWALLGVFLMWTHCKGCLAL